MSQGKSPRHFTLVVAQLRLQKSGPRRARQGSCRELTEFLLTYIYSHVLFVVLPVTIDKPADHDVRDVGLVT